VAEFCRRRFVLTLHACEVKHVDNDFDWRAVHNSISVPITDRLYERAGT
jgi:hypothetical protein